MKTVKLGIIREGKVPSDKRVPLTPEHCLLVQANYPQVEVVVQTSPVRAIPDSAYSAAGIPIVESLVDCDVIMGVKEVNITDLIPGKKFLFFSHTIKKQPYNRKLLKAVLDKKIQLIDYEVLKDKNNKRIIGFGRYAGIVGCYNGMLAYGKKTGLFTLTPANQCADRSAMEAELKKVIFPADARMVLTGFGRVGNGAREIMKLLPITEVSPDDYMTKSFDSPVFTHLDTADYYQPRDKSEFKKQDFYSNPSTYTSVLNGYVSKADIYVACHFWSNKSPNLLTQSDLQGDSRLKVVADISCDIAGPIACTIRPSVIADPMYGYDPITGAETAIDATGSIVVMAVDNLPCELPIDASVDFGNELIQRVLPALFGNDTDAIIERGSETNLAGELTPLFSYLEDYVAGN